MAETTPERPRCALSASRDRGPIQPEQDGICESQNVMDERREPPRHIWYELDEAIDLLAVLEDAQLTALDARALALVVVLERQIELLHRKLEIGDPGGSDG